MEIIHKAILVHNVRMLATLLLSSYYQSLYILARRFG